MIEIRPEFDVATKSWFWDEFEAPTLRELQKQVGRGVHFLDYYPMGLSQAINLRRSQNEERRRKPFALGVPKHNLDIPVATPPKPTQLSLQAVKIVEPPSKVLVTKVERIIKAAVEIREKRSIQYAARYRRTPEEASELRAKVILFLEQGVLTTGQIARQLGCTKNTIVGIRYRWKHRK
jgi:hypothetical protein